MTEQRLRGRRGRDRHIAEASAELAGRRSRPGQEGTRPAGPARVRVADLASLPPLLAATAELRGLAERYARVREGRVGRDLRHVVYASMPHGAKTYLAAALALATGERLVWIARDAEIADRVAEELVAWLGDPSAIVVLEPRTALAYERESWCATRRPRGSPPSPRGGTARGRGSWSAAPRPSSSAPSPRTRSRPPRSSCGAGRGCPRNACCAS